MTIIIVDGVAPAVKYAIKSTTDPIAKLQWEPEFYQQAWEALQPYIGDWRARLMEEMEEYGYEGTSGVVASVFGEPLASALVGITNADASDEGNLTLPILTDNVYIAATARTPSFDLHIARILQCLYPGHIHITIQPSGDDTSSQAYHTQIIPDRHWLLTHEMILREAFGCTYFRYLVDAARRQ